MARRTLRRSARRQRRLTPTSGGRRRPTARARIGAAAVAASAAADADGGGHDEQVPISTSPPRARGRRVAPADVSTNSYEESLHRGSRSMPSSTPARVGHGAWHIEAWHQHEGTAMASSVGAGPSRQLLDPAEDERVPIVLGGSSVCVADVARAALSSLAAGDRAARRRRSRLLDEQRLPWASFEDPSLSVNGRRATERPRRPSASVVSQSQLHAEPGRSIDRHATTRHRTSQSRSTDLGSPAIVDHVDRSRVPPSARPRRRA